MAYTIRTDEKSEEALSTLMNVTGENSVSKALLKAAVAYPDALEHIDKLKRSVEELSETLEGIKEAYQTKLEAENLISVYMNS